MYTYKQYYMHGVYICADYVMYVIETIHVQCAYILLYIAISYSIHFYMQVCRIEMVLGFPTTMVASI